MVTLIKSHSGMRWCFQQWPFLSVGHFHLIHIAIMHCLLKMSVCGGCPSAKLHEKAVQELQRIQFILHVALRPLLTLFGEHLSGKRMTIGWWKRITFWKCNQDLHIFYHLQLIMCLFLVMTCLMISLPASISKHHECGSACCMKHVWQPLSFGVS